MRGGKVKNQKFQSKILRFRFVQLFVGILIGAIIASAVFIFAGSAFALNTADEPVTLTTTNVVVKNPAVVNPEVQIFIDQAYVSKIVNNEIHNEPNFSNAVVDLQPPNLALITLDVRINPLITLRHTVTLAFEASDNRVQIQITEINLGGYSIPLSLVQGPLNDLTQMMQDRINSLTEAMQQQTGLELRRVSATDMDLVLDLGENQAQLTPTP
jgi:hypothetical protein